MKYIILSLIMLILGDLRPAEFLNYDYQIGLLVGIFFSTCIVMANKHGKTTRSN